MAITLTTTKEKRFRTLLEIYSVVSPYSKLRPREKDVLAVLYELNYKYSHLPIEQRELLIFHKSSRKQVAEASGMTIVVFYNIVKDLTKKGILGKDCFIQKFIINNTDEVVYKLQEKI